MDCPNCGSEMWDNRAKNRERVAKGLKPTPDFKCKSCEHVIWPPKDGYSANSVGAKKQSAQTEIVPTMSENEQKKQLIIAREAACHAITRVSAGTGMVPEEIIKRANVLVDYFYNGLEPETGEDPGY